MIGLLVPSDALVLGEGGIGASPFVYGQSTSYHNERLGTNTVLLSRPRASDPELGSCHQCHNAHLHHLTSEHGLVHCLADSLWIRSPTTSSKNLQKGDKARSSCLGVTLLLALQLPCLHEFRAARRCVSYKFLQIRPLTSSNSLCLSGQHVSNIWRNYLE